MKDFEIRCDESHLEANYTLYGKFTLGPFLPGQGTTFGNALRRTLLSELSGLAITAFEILGVMQEFSTLSGLRESILDLSLNLKQVVLTGLLPHSTPPVGFLKIKGPAIIKAIDLKLPVGVYCSHPDQYIATLASNGALNLKFIVSVGKGYSVQPYSLYRSLSKIKLQPALSSHLEKNDTRHDYLHFFEQQNIEGVSSEGKVNTRSLVDAKDGKKKLAATQKELGVEKIVKKELIPSHKIRSKKDSYETIKTETVSPLVPGFIEKEKEQETMDMHIYDQQSHQKRIQPGHFEPFKPSLTSFKSANNTNATLITGAGSKNSVDIQTQAFQRVNPHQVLPIDAVFTPVSRVNFLTQANDRFETIRENVVLEIWTNGSIHPKRALEEATLFLVQNFDTLLKKIQQSSSFYKGLRYWNYLESINSTNIQTKKTMKENASDDISDAKSSLSEMSSLQVPVSSQTKDGKDALFLQKAHKVYERESMTNINFVDTKILSSEKGKKNNEYVLSQNLVGSKSRYFQNYLHQAVSNLDIGNLNLSLQTFITLKKAKIHTLSQLLTTFFLEDNKLILNPKNSFFLETFEKNDSQITQTEYKEVAVVHLKEAKQKLLFLNEKTANELKNIIRHFKAN